MSLDDVNPFVIFEAKLDKDRGIVILTIRKEEVNENHFFRFHHQPLDCHPEELQMAIRSHRITARTKSIRVNVYEYCAHYWNSEKKWFEFKGTRLNSNVQQLQKVLNTKVNKEIGLLKRQEAGVKGRKEAEMEAAKERNDKFEEEFQKERAKRIAEVMADIKKKRSAME